MLAAEVQYSTLLRSLLIALVVVAPFGWYQWQKVRRARAEAEAATAPPPAPDEPGARRPRLEDVVAAIGPSATPTEVSLPDDVTLDGQQVTPDVVELLVADALRRSRLVETGRSRRDGVTILRCAPSADGAP